MPVAFHPAKPLTIPRWGIGYADVMRSFAAMLAALAAALCLSSCTAPSSDGHTDHEHTDAPAGYNADDVAFATNMIPHHQQAVELSGLVPDRSTNPALVKLAADIAAAQQPEIETMTAFFVQWNENPDSSTGHGDHGMAMQGMVDQATMTELESLNGAEFDTLWLESMISHHQGAIEMAKAEIANGENVDAVGLAKHIVDTQQAEIGQMKQMLGG
jgi:uncharacterized protein (DUF305 family)